MYRQDAFFLWQVNIEIFAIVHHVAAKEKEDRMKIYVCVKYVPDSAAHITIKGKNHFDESVKHVINPYDEIAVEEAIRIKERDKNSEVIAVTLGNMGALSILRASLAMGSDRGILIKTDKKPDSIMTARGLAAAILQDGKPDIIFTGRESIDSEGMQTMFRLAAALDIPVATDVVAFSEDLGRVTVEREIEAGAREVVEMSIPCLIGAGKGLNTPRYLKIPDIMKAKKKEVKQIDLDSLDFEDPACSTEVLELEPAVEKRHCIILEGDPEQITRQLVDLIELD